MKQEPLPSAARPYDPLGDSPFRLPTIDRYGSKRQHSSYPTNHRESPSHRNPWSDLRSAVSMRPGRSSTTGPRSTAAISPLFPYPRTLPTHRHLPPPPTRPPHPSNPP